jgi:hypothetical protein
MTYREELINQLKNPDGYLWFENSNPFSELNGLADDFVSRNFTEGKIASLFIYHQLTENILILLLRYCNLIIKASVYPTEFYYKEINDIRFQKRIELLDQTIEFEGKQRLLDCAKSINKLRNEYGHRFIDRYSVEEIDDELNNIKSRFDEFFHLWRTSMADIYNNISRIKKRFETN